MSSLRPSTFADLLRRYRQAAGLTQEELAERARLSVQAIGALERGDRRAPRKETVGLLAEALSLTESERGAFEVAARQRGQTDQSAPGDIIREQAVDTPSPPADETISATQSARQHHGVRSILQHDRARSIVLYVRGILSRRIVSVPLAGVLLVALLGSALLVNATGTGRSSLLCGGEIALATDFPTLASYGKSGEDAANLAVMQNRDLGGGYSLKVINFDDTATTGDDVGIAGDPSRGAENMASMVKNTCIVGMVGPYNSKVALTEMPIAANAGLAMISPTNTNPGLTIRQYATDTPTQDANSLFDQLHPVGKATNYFRVIASDALQPAAAADFTAGELAARRVYIVVSQPSSYGGLIVGGFTTEFLAKGGTIVATENLEWHNPQAFPAMAARIAATEPDAVYFGGIDLGGAPILKQQLVLHGYTGPFVSGDAIANDPTLIEQAGVAAAQNTYAIGSEPDITSFTDRAGATFLRDYRARYPGQQVDGYCALAYDAAMVEITALKHLIGSGHPVTRTAMIDQVQNIQYTGVTGAIRFDKNGDDVYNRYTVYFVQDGTWIPYARVAA